MLGIEFSPHSITQIEILDPLFPCSLSQLLPHFITSQAADFAGSPLSLLQKPIGVSSVMNWIQRKVHLYNVTFGLYMLDWWERYLFNILVIVLMWFIFHNSSKYITDLCKSDFKCLVTSPRERMKSIFHGVA